eukprot:g38415.t1
MHLNSQVSLLNNTTQFTMWNLVKGFAKVHVDNVYCSALIYLSGHIVKKLNQLSTRGSNLQGAPSMYCEAKLAAEPYQAAKRQLFKALRKADLGTWVKKPPEQDQFLPTAEGQQTKALA